MFKYILISILLISCGKKEAQKAHAIKDPIELSGNSYQALNAKNFYTTADTFTFFFFPKLGTINWESPLSLWKKNDSQIDKMAAIVENVIKTSEKVDRADYAAYQLFELNKKLEKQMSELNCDMMGENPNQEACDKLATQVEENMMTAIDFSSTKKSAYIRDIQMSVDHVKFSEVHGETTMSFGQFFNWVEYGDANQYIVDVTNPNKIRIVFPTLGNVNGGNYYSTDKGDIFDVKLAPSEFAPHVTMLSFKVREKNSEGQENGNIWEVELEKSDFIGKIRFSGDVLRKKGSKLIQQGVMKFEFAAIE